MTTVTKRLVGYDPNQVPRNRDLGRFAFTDSVMVQVPASATAQGNKGDVAQDDDWVYVCIAQNTWKRSALTTW